jgi:carboxylate-amine ligase
MDALTLGVEEEFLLVDPDTWRVVARADEVLARIPDELHEQVSHELLATQVELATPTCSDLGELREWLVRLREALARAARESGCRLMAAGTGLYEYAGRTPVAPGDRYARMAEEFGELVNVQGLCACHVHVGVENREMAVAVSNHVRVWLPVLHALTVNSPFTDGRDTGYASWRSVQWSRWPTSGPPPWMDSLNHHDQFVDGLVAAGAMVDPRMVYWYARLSPRYPTIEVRVGDVPPRVDDTLLVAALTRALVGTAVHDVVRGRDAVRRSDQALVAAHWRAARDGLEGAGLDPLSGDLRPTWDLLDLLVERVRPALRARGDEELVAQLLARVRAEGSGAARQRAVFARSGDLDAVARFLVGLTAANE